jgi:hypothetical protein
MVRTLGVKTPAKVPRRPAAWESSDAVGFGSLDGMGSLACGFESSPGPRADERSGPAPFKTSSGIPSGRQRFWAVMIIRWFMKP